MKKVLSRRALMGHLLVGSVALPAVGVVGQANAAAAGPLVNPADPTAKALGYVPDASKVDPKTNPTFKPGQNCAGCVQYVGKAGDAQAGCNLFPGKQVPAKGWCRVWAAKPAAAPAPAAKK